MAHRQAQQQLRAQHDQQAVQQLWTQQTQQQVRAQRAVQQQWTQQAQQQMQAQQQAQPQLQPQQQARQQLQPQTQVQQQLQPQQQVQQQLRSQQQLQTQQAQQDVQQLRTQQQAQPQLQPQKQARQQLRLQTQVQQQLQPQQQVQQQLQPQQQVQRQLQSQQQLQTQQAQQDVQQLRTQQQAQPQLQPQKQARQQLRPQTQVQQQLQPQQQVQRQLQSQTQLQTQQAQQDVQQLRTQQQAQPQLRPQQQTEQHLSPQQERHEIWHGTLEWTLHNETGNTQVSVLSVDGRPAVTAGDWPQQLVMKQVLPKEWIGKIDSSYLRNPESVLIQLQAGGAVLVKRLSKQGIVGCVRLGDRKVMIVSLAGENGALLGYVPIDQSMFVKRLEQEVKRYKTNRASPSQNQGDDAGSSSFDRGSRLGNATNQQRCDKPRGGPHDPQRPSTAGSPGGPSTNVPSSQLSDRVGLSDRSVSIELQAGPDGANATQRGYLARASAGPSTSRAVDDVPCASAKVENADRRVQKMLPQTTAAQLASKKTGRVVQYGGEQSSRLKGRSTAATNSNDYTDAHRLLLQALASNRMLGELELENIYGCLFESGVPTLEAAIRSINSKLAPLSMSVSKVVCEITGKTVYIYYRTVKSGYSRPLTNTDKALIPRIFTAIVMSRGKATCDTVADVSRILFEKEARPADWHETVDRLIEERLLARTYEGSLCFTALTIVELGPVLRAEYGDAINECPLCTHIIFYGRACPTCHCLIHRHCFESFAERSKTNRCPKCGTRWTAPSRNGSDDYDNGQGSRYGQSDFFAQLTLAGPSTSGGHF